MPTSEQLRTHDELRGGAAAMAPLLVGYAPFAIVVGAASAAGPEPWAGWAATFLVFGGSAHLAVVQLLDAGAALGTVVLTGLVIQARLIVYSASLAQEWRGWSRRSRLVLAATIVDPTWALAQERSRRAGSVAAKQAWYVGAAGTLAAGWGALVAVGFVAGARLPASPAWDLIAPLVLLALVVPQLGTSGARRAAVAGTIAALLAAELPAGTAVLAAMAAGAVAGRGRTRGRGQP
jgi:predicted branched-subunit amino acid permease